MNIAVRFANKMDAEEITKIFNYYVTHSISTFDLEPRSVEDRRSWILAHDPDTRCKLLVAVDTENSLLTGYASTSPFRPQAAYNTSVEASIYVLPEYRGKGIGQLLYEHLFALLSDTDVHRVYACLSVPNLSSFKLHQKFGFNLVGTFSEAGYKHKAFHDIQWLEKKL